MDIQTQAIAFRKAMESCKKKFKSTGLRFFPKGCSGEVADLFGRYLLERFQIETDHVTAWQPINHTWLQFDDWVIDLLHDQHGERHPSDVPVIVSKSEEFYGRCFVVHRRKAGITGVAGQTATVEEYEMILAGLELELRNDKQTIESGA